MNDIDDSFFDNLNKVIETWLYTDDHLIYEEELSKIVCLAKIILDNSSDLTQREMEDYVDINESIKLSTEFFQSINPEYAYKLQNIINWEKNTYNGKEDYSVRFYRTCDKKIPDYEGQNNNLNSYANINGFVHIDYENTINDVFSISHEMTHKFSSPHLQNNIIKRLFGETSSLEIEFLLYDYLMNKGLYIKDINRVIVNRFSSSCRNAWNVLFEYTLLKLYRENNNSISKNILLEYLNSMDKSSKMYKYFYHNGIRLLKLILKRRELIFPKSQRYVIGLILACDFHRRLKNDKDVINELFKLIEIFGKGYICEEDIKALDKFIPIIDIDEVQISFKVNDENLERLTESYRSELKCILDSQEKLESAKGYKK